MTKSTESVVWYNDDHRAWSANTAVRDACIAYQKRNETFGTTSSIIGIILTILCTIVSGDWGNFLAFLLLFAGLIMIIGNIRNVNGT